MRRRALALVVLAGFIAPVGIAGSAEAVNTRTDAATVFIVDESPRADGCVDRRSIVIDAGRLAAPTIDLPAGTYVSASVYEHVRCGALFGIGQFTLASFQNPVSSNDVRFTGSGATIDTHVPATVVVDGVEQVTTIHVAVAVQDRQPADPRVNGVWSGSATGSVTGAVGGTLIDLGDVVWTGLDPAADEFAAASVQASTARRILGPPSIFWSEVWRREAVGMSSNVCRDDAGRTVGSWEVTAWRTGSTLAGIYARVDAACGIGIEFVVTTFGATQPDGTYLDEDAVTFVALPGSDRFLGRDDINSLGLGDAPFETFGMLEHSGDPCVGLTSPVDYVIGGSVTAC